MHDIIDGKISEWYIAVAYDDGRLVAWRLWFREKRRQYYYLYRFTKKDYRQKGIQKRLQRRKPKLNEKYKLVKGWGII